MGANNMFFTHFLVCLLVSAFTFGGIILTKKIFHKQLSAKWQYNLWFLLFIALTFPLIPNHLFHFGDAFTFNMNQSNETGQATASTGDRSLQGGNWMQDFTDSVNRFDFAPLSKLLATIWIIGMVVMTVLTVHAWLKVKKIKSTTSPIENKAVLSLFNRCKQRLHISRHLSLGESPCIKTPLTFGLFKTYIVLPSDFEEWLSLEEIEYILLHELNHYKYKDIATNYLIVLYQMLYWFNPLVWIAFREMRLDREIACDTAVLKALDKNCYTAYGNTIIHFVDNTSRSTYFHLVNPLSGAKQQIKKRIESIASFTPESKLLKWKSRLIFMIVGVFVAIQFPIISVMAYDDDQYTFENENAVYEDLSKYFSGYEGSFVLYDLQADQYSIYNKDKSTTRISPDSTYKIYSALFALESNVITSQASTIKWNGKQYPYDAWNKDQNLSDAMRNSVTWYFQELDKSVQSDHIQAYLKQIGYGNYNISGGLSQYWLESSLKISPVEQVKSLKALYTNDFKFEDKHIQTVKDMIKLEEKDDAMLSGKTGTGNVNGKNRNGWFIGYVESNDDTYFFATNIQQGNNPYGSKAAEITKSILRDKGIY